MNRTIALVLAVVLPCTAFAQQLETLTPATEQPMPALKLDDGARAETPFYKRWTVWAGAGVVVATVAAITAALVVGSRPQSAPLMKQDFPCQTAGSCDGWVNEPPR